MNYRIEVAFKIPDTRAQVRQKQLGVKVVKLVDTYTINKNFTPEQLKKILRLLTGPETQIASISSPTNKKPLNPGKFSWAIEVGFLPGVTDNLGSTVEESIEDLFKKPFKRGQAVYTTQITYIADKLNKDQIQAIADSLYNPLIQRVSIKSFTNWRKDHGMSISVPKVTLTTKPQTDQLDLDISDQQLTKIGKQGIVNPDGSRRGPLALNLKYLKTIKAHFKKLNRKPTDLELEALAQTWSQHCKHTIFADPIDNLKHGLFRTYIKAATEKIRKQKGKRDITVSVFADNSGAIAFDKNYIITDKAETHNSPSAMDPFGGAITGIVGVNRDTLGFGLGAKPIINRYGFCFADPKDKTVLYKGANKTQKMLSAKRIMLGVIHGVNVGGNTSGIPTPQGFQVFDPRFRGKPLVFVGTVGLMPRKSHGRLAHQKQAQPGDYVVVIGGRVGQDGIHGATFSSEALDTGSPVGAVQIGDPITQKKFSDALVREARDRGLFNSITDNGAGGISCSVAEMAQESGGCQVNLDKVPLKYPGLAPWQIWISESQERMTLAVPKKHWLKFKRLMNSRGVEATRIGKFTNSGKCIVTFKGEKIMNLSMKFLHYGLPKTHLKTSYTPKKHPNPKIPQPKNLTSTLKAVLARPNIAGFGFISSQYDHEVQASSVTKPLQGKGLVNADATVVRPVLTSPKAIILSQGINPTYSDIDTYHMAACAVDTAVRNAVAAGASLDHLALMDNFCWSSSDQPQRLGELKRAAKACYDYATAYGAPFISGKDSMFNDFKGYDVKGKPIKISVPPTLLISSTGVIADATKAVTLDAKFPGDLIYVLGSTHDELGASEYYALQGDFLQGVSFIGNSVPQVNAKTNKTLYQALTQAINQDLIASAQSVHRGGLAVALAKTAMGGLLGLNVSLKNLKGNFSRPDFTLFSESQGRVVVTINPQNQSSFEKLIPANLRSLIGAIAKNNHFLITDKTGKPLVNAKVNDLLKAYRSTFKNY